MSVDIGRDVAKISFTKQRHRSFTCHSHHHHRST